MQSGDDETLVESKGPVSPVEGSEGSRFLRPVLGFQESKRVGDKFRDEACKCSRGEVDGDCFLGRIFNMFDLLILKPLFKREVESDGENESWRDISF